MVPIMYALLAGLHVLLPGSWMYPGCQLHMIEPDRGLFKDRSGAVSLFHFDAAKLVPWQTDVTDLAVAPDGKQVIVAKHVADCRVALSIYDLSHWPPGLLLSAAPNVTITSVTAARATHDGFAACWYIDGTENTFPIAGVSLLSRSPDRNGKTRLEFRPLPVLSGFMGYAYTGSLLFAPGRPYTYAAYGFIDNRSALPDTSFQGKAPRIEGLEGVREPDQHVEFMMIVVDARQPFLYPVTGPSRAVGFSRDGTAVLVALVTGWPDPATEWSVVDLETGGKTVCRWIPQNTKAVLAVAPDLQTAVVRTSHAVTAVSSKRRSTTVTKFPKPQGYAPLPAPSSAPRSPEEWQKIQEVAEKAAFAMTGEAYWAAADYLDGTFYVVTEESLFTIRESDLSVRQVPRLEDVVESQEPAGQAGSKRRQCPQNPSKR